MTPHAFAPVPRIREVGIGLITIFHGTLVKSSQAIRLDLYNQYSQSTKRPDGSTDDEGPSVFAEELEA